jgi:hypothetical protein
MTIATEYESVRSSRPATVDDPTQDVPDHRGEPRQANSELFAAPPAEIGHILSAESTLKMGRREWPILVRTVIIGLPAAQFLAYVWWESGQVQLDDLIGAIIFPAFLSAVAVGVAWYFTRFQHRCTYVGKNGIAIFELRGRRNARLTQQMLLFANARELHTNRTRHYVNCYYRNTSYDYQWTSLEGTSLLRLHGTYVGNNEPPKAKDPFHLAAAAEAAWSMCALARAQRQLEDEGSIAFGIGGQRAIRIGYGFIEFHFDGEPVRVFREEIGRVSLSGGHLSFKHKNAKWYRSEGKYFFAYSSMANANVFLLALDKLVGYRIT